MKLIRSLCSIGMSSLNTMNKYKSGQVWILAIVFVFFFALNLIVPLWGNILLGFGALTQSSIDNSFPELIFEADYIRGFVYKLLLYGIMNVTEVFVEKSQFYNYQLLSKTVYYTFCFLISFWFLKVSLKNRTITEIVKIWLSFWIILFLSGYRQFMEAEELAVIFALGHFLFIYSHDKRLNYASGVFVFLLFGCKAITVLYSGLGLLYLLFYSFKDKIIRIALSHFIFGLITLVLFLTFFYPEIENIKSAMVYQGSMGLNGLNTVANFIQSYMEFIPYIPVLIFPFFILINSFFTGKKALLFWTLSFLLASAAVLMQNRFSSPYHYLSFLPGILLFFLGYIEKECLVNYLPIKKSHFLMQKFFSATIFFFIGGYVFFQSLNNTSYIEYASNYLYKKYFIQQTELYSSINNHLNQDSLSPILLLSGDCPPFFVPNKSASKKVSAMLLNRSLIRPTLSQSPQYREYFDFILDFEGKFILLDEDYVDLHKFPRIEEKIKIKYSKVEYYENDINFLGETKLTLFKRIGSQ